MKLSIPNIVGAIGLSALLSYACYAMCDVESLKSLITIGAAVQFLIYTFGMLVYQHSEDSRLTAVVRTLSGVVFVVALISNFIFACTDFSTPLYIILNGLVLLIYFLVAAGIARSN